MLLIVSNVVGSTVAGEFPQSIVGRSLTEPNILLLLFMLLLTTATLLLVVTLDGK